MRQNPAVNGLMLGVALIIVAFIFQMVSARAYIVSAPMLMFVVVIAFLVKSAIDKRNLNDGYLSLGDAFMAAFITSAIGTTMCCFFEYALYNFINPDLMVEASKIAQETAEKAGEMLGGIFGENEEMTKALEEAKADPSLQDFKLTPGLAMINVFTRLIWPGVICSFIIGLITKKDHKA